jgi:hypothetical protein
VWKEEATSVSGETRAEKRVAAKVLSKTKVDVRLELENCVVTRSWIMQYTSRRLQFKKGKCH